MKKYVVEFIKIFLITFLVAILYDLLISNKPIVEVDFHMDIFIASVLGCASIIQTYILQK